MDPDQDSELLIYRMYLDPQEIFTDPEHLYYPDQRAKLTFFLLILQVGGIYSSRLLCQAWKPFSTFYILFFIFLVPCD